MVGLVRRAIGVAAFLLAGAIEILSRSHACAEKFFLSRELCFRKHERRFDLLARCLFRSFVQSE